MGRSRRRNQKSTATNSAVNANKQRKNSSSEKDVNMKVLSDDHQELSRKEVENNKKKLHLQSEYGDKTHKKGTLRSDREQCGFSHERRKPEKHMLEGASRSESSRNNIDHESSWTSKQVQRGKVTIHEVEGDLFTAPENHSLAHCVAEDLRMGSGIAVTFRQMFKRVDELLDQRKTVGDIAVLEEKTRFIYYLITKRYSTGKPLLGDLYYSLVKMKEHIVMYNVQNLAIPRIGCGLDRLSWSDVKKMLLEVFDEVDVTFTVYNFNIEMGGNNSVSKKSSLYVRNKLMKISDMERETLLVVFGSECGHVNAAMSDLDQRYKFINDYKCSPRKVGDVLSFQKLKEIICVLIIKKNGQDGLSFSALNNCLSKLKSIFKKEQYFYMAFPAFIECNDTMMMSKIISLFKIIFGYMNCELWICWPNELKTYYDEHVSYII